MYYILYGRQKNHFSSETIDWYSQKTICGSTVRGKVSEKKYDDTAVDCTRCMTKAGFIKKQANVGSASEPMKVGYSQTEYKVLRPYTLGHNTYNVGDVFWGVAYNHAIGAWDK